MSAFGSPKLQGDWVHWGHLWSSARVTQIERRVLTANLSTDLAQPWGGPVLCQMLSVQVVRGSPCPVARKEKGEVKWLEQGQLGLEIGTESSWWLDCLSAWGFALGFSSSVKPVHPFYLLSALTASKETLVTLPHTHFIVSLTCWKLCAHQQLSQHDLGVMTWVGGEQGRRRGNIFLLLQLHFTEEWHLQFLL